MMCAVQEYGGYLEMSFLTLISMRKSCESKNGTDISVGIFAQSNSIFWANKKRYDCFCQKRVSGKHAANSTIKLI